MKKLNFIFFSIIMILVFACKDTNSIEKKETSRAENTITTTLKITTKTYLNAWSENDTTVHRLVTTKNLVRNVNGKIVSINQKELFKTMNFWHRAMPDLKIDEKEISVIGTRAYVNWIGRGSNTGMLGNTPPTGKKGYIEGMSILTFDDAGYIVHEATFFNLLGLMEEWGYTMSPPIME